MREVSKRASICFAALSKLLGRDQYRRHKAAGDEHDAHDQSRPAQQLLGIADTAPQQVSCGAFLVARASRSNAGPVALTQIGVTFDERHDCDTCLKAGETECQLRKQEQRHRNDEPRISMNTRLLEECLLPFRKVEWMHRELE